MKLRITVLALAMAAGLAQAADTPPDPVPQTPDQWLQRMTDFTRNASAYRDPRVFVPWLNAVTEPGFYTAAGQGMIDPAGWLNMFNSMAHPDAIRNWMWMMDPAVYVKWLQASMDPAFYTAVLSQLSDPGKAMRWAMWPMDPKLWNVMLSTLNPNTYIRWGMAGMDPRTWNLMGNLVNPALYTGMLGTTMNPQTYGPVWNSWLSWKPPAPVVGASNPWGGEHAAGFNLFDPALLMNMATFLPTLGLPTLPAPAASAPAQAAAAPPAPPAPEAAPATPEAAPAAPVVAPSPPPAPAPEPAAAPVEKMVLSGDALFTLGKSGIKDLSKEGKKRLDDVVAKILAIGEIEQIRIVGHADASGKAKANLKLSEARAQSVKTYLVSKGVKPDVIITSGVGDTQPLVQCDMKMPKAKLAECLAPNRRVEIDVTLKAK